jgi:hypothetical protein
MNAGEALLNLQEGTCRVQGDKRRARSWIVMTQEHLVGGLKEELSECSKTRA